MRDALWALLHFDFALAFYSHPMVWSLPLLPLLVLTGGRPTRSRRVNGLILLYTYGCVGVQGIGAVSTEHNLSLLHTYHIFLHGS